MLLMLRTLIFVAVCFLADSNVRHSLRLWRFDWFSKTPFKDSYTENIWWPHLVDRAGAVGAEYGVQPMAFTVHAEWINRPSVVIVNQEGVVRFAYYGTFWGDRPSIRQLLEMVRGGNYSFAAPKRLKPNSKP